jgi:uncharacterized protein (DUF58 family)
MRFTPENRLLVWVGLIVLPFAFLGAVEPLALGLSLLLIAGLGVLVLLDAWRAGRRLAGISVHLPAVVRMSRNREARLDIRIRNEEQSSQRLRLAVGLPWAIQSPQEDRSVDLPGGAEWSRFDWPCLPVERGRYLIDAAYVGATSRLGFWTVRKKVGTQSEVRVYPNLFRERRELAGLFLRHGGIGLHTQRQIGRGREFEKLREYVPGDGYDEIHWKATARRGRPITKVFQIERTQAVYIVIDAARLSGRPVSDDRNSRSKEPKPDRRADPARETTVPTTTLDRFITAALTLGLAAEQQGDLFGLLTFSDKVERFIRARNGKAHYSTCRDILYRLQPKMVTPDFDELFTFIRLRVRHRALIIFLTSLDDPVLAEAFVRNIDLIRRQHVVLVNMLQPPGLAPVFSDANISSVDALYQRLGGHLRWQSLRELEKVLQRRGVHFGLLKNERLSAQLVSQYLDIKRKQVL